MKLPYASYLAVVGPCLNGSLVVLSLSSLLSDVSCPSGQLLIFFLCIHNNKHQDSFNLSVLFSGLLPVCSWKESKGVTDGHLSCPQIALNMAPRSLSGPIFLFWALSIKRIYVFCHYSLWTSTFSFAQITLLTRLESKLLGTQKEVFESKRKWRRANEVEYGTWTADRTPER
jgi:hypothetical protein